MKNDEQLKKESPELYHIAREGGTEPAFTGKYVDNHEKGMFKCAVCGTELFSSDTKFDSGTGWPSFTEPTNLANVERDQELRRTSRSRLRRRPCRKRWQAVLYQFGVSGAGKRLSIGLWITGFAKP